MSTGNSNINSYFGFCCLIFLHEEVKEALDMVSVEAPTLHSAWRFLPPRGSHSHVLGKDILNLIVSESCHKGLFKIFYCEILLKLSRIIAESIADNWVIKIQY